MNVGGDVYRDANVTITPVHSTFQQRAKTEKARVGPLLGSKNFSKKSGRTWKHLRKKKERSQVYEVSPERFSRRCDAKI